MLTMGFPAFKLKKLLLQHMGWVSRPETLLLQPWEPNLMTRGRYWGWKVLEDLQVSHIQSHTGSACGCVCCLWTSPERIQPAPELAREHWWTWACPTFLQSNAHTGNIPEAEANGQKPLPEQQTGLMVHSPGTGGIQVQPVWCPKPQPYTSKPPSSISFFFCHG